MKLNYKKLGKGKPVIIAHGLFGSLDNWMTIGKSISEFFEVFLVDMRNHGRSHQSDKMSFELMAEDVKEFIEDHSLSEPTIIGHSMGGKMAMQFALFYPELIDKLIVIDIGPKAYEPHHDHIIAALKSIDFKKLKSRKQANELLAAQIPEEGTRQLLLKGLYRKNSGEFDLRYNLNAISSNIDQVIIPLTAEPVSVPSLFIRGSNSDYILNEDFQSIENLFPNSEIETIEDAGHWVHADNPEGLLNTVLPFLIYS